MIGCLNCTYNDGQNGTLSFNPALFTCLTCDNSVDYFMNSGTCTFRPVSNSASLVAPVAVSPANPGSV